MSRKSSNDDYRFKSCMFYQNVQLWTSGTSLHLSSGPVNTKNEIVKIIF